jgi:hypothetical protein
VQQQIELSQGFLIPHCIGAEDEINGLSSAEVVLWDGLPTNLLMPNTQGHTKF